MTHHQTETTFEVEVSIAGCFYPGRPASYMDPADPGEVDDIEVVAVSMLRRELDRVTLKSRWIPVDLLDGLDKAARAQIEANILAFLGEEAEELIVAAARS